MIPPSGEKIWGGGGNTDQNIIPVGEMVNLQIVNLPYIKMTKTLD
jgi:hypothetical protein